jgi:hypothetical protein
MGSLIVSIQLPRLRAVRRLVESRGCVYFLWAFGMRGLWDLDTWPLREANAAVFLFFGQELGHRKHTIFSSPSLF